MKYYLILASLFFTLFSFGQETTDTVAKVWSLEYCIAYSLDNNIFNEIGKVERESNLKSTKVFREEYSINSQIIKARYIKIHAKNVKVCPEWHKGSGGPAWIFSDEITIN